MESVCAHMLILIKVHRYHCSSVLSLLPVIAACKVFDKHLASVCIDNLMVHYLITQNMVRVCFGNWISFIKQKEN